MVPLETATIGPPSGPLARTNSVEPQVPQNERSSGFPDAVAWSLYVLIDSWPSTTSKCYGSLACVPWPIIPIDCEDTLASNMQFAMKADPVTFWQLSQ